MKHVVTCTQKTLAIDFDSLPKRICSFEGHDALNDLIVAAIPECDREGLDGGFYRQCLAVWITLACEDMTDDREKEIREAFLNITRQYCRLKA